MRQIHRRLPSGGVLVFVTGQREVEHLVARLRAGLAPAAASTAAPRGNGNDRPPTPAEEVRAAAPGGALALRRRKWALGPAWSGGLLCRLRPVLSSIVNADAPAVCRPQAETEAELAGADAAERDADAGDPGLDPADYEEVLLLTHSLDLLECTAFGSLPQRGCASKTVQHLRPET